MIVTLKDSIELEDSMVFEDCYEAELRLDLNYKREILHRSAAIWMYVDGELVGETYGIEPYFLAELGDGVEDVSVDEKGTIYCYSTTLLPAFRGKGLSKILKAYWFGLISTAYTCVAGHATSPEAVKLNASFGAIFSTRHKQWFGSAREAVFYRIDV